MSRLILVLLLALLAGCGSKEGGDLGKGSTAQPVNPTPVEGDLSDLDGYPLQDFVRALVPRLAKDARIQTPAQLAAALGQNWKIHCEQICRIERK